MTEITRIAIDTSKSVFTLHGVDAAGRALLRRNLRRRELRRFFERLGPVEVALEACGGSGAGRARAPCAADPAGWSLPSGRPRPDPWVKPPAFERVKDSVFCRD